MKSLATAMEVICLSGKKMSASSHEDIDYVVPGGCFSSKLTFKLK
jgi:hypothetical protein